MVTLTYPYTSPSVTLILPNPLLGDADQTEQNFNLDWSSSGRIYTYKKAPASKKLLLTFDSLTFTDRANLKLFLYSAVNNSSGYKDQLNVQWRGVFINDPFEQSNTARQYGAITLEFRGVKT